MLASTAAPEGSSQCISDGGVKNGLMKPQGNRKVDLLNDRQSKRSRPSQGGLMARVV